MRKQLLYWDFSGFLFVSLIGSLLHFVFAWSGENILAAAFSSVNESTWEHMKLLFCPIFLFSVIQIFALGKNYPNFLAVRTVSTLSGLIMIPVLFYTYTGILGYDLNWANIVVFVLSALIAFALDFFLMRQGWLSAPWQQIASLLILWALAFAFVWCTFHPLRIALWQDPVTGQYGF